MMDDFGHGVRVTLIDLGLSRMDAGDGDGGEMIHWTPFDDEIFMGEGWCHSYGVGCFLINPPLGDYQFDIYRMMKVQNDDSWEPFKPLTNVMVRFFSNHEVLGAADFFPCFSGYTTLPSSFFARNA